MFNVGLFICLLVRVEEPTFLCSPFGSHASCEVPAVDAVTVLDLNLGTKLSLAAVLVGWSK